MLCFICPKPGAYHCGDLDRPLCEEHAHTGLVRDAVGIKMGDCCIALPDPDVLGVLAVQFEPGGAEEVLRTYLKMHEGRVGRHWLYSAISRIVAGESEAEVMADFRWYPESAIRAAAHDEAAAVLPRVVSLVRERDALRAALDRARDHVTEAAKHVNEPAAFRWLDAIDGALAKAPRVPT